MNMGGGALDLATFINTAMDKGGGRSSGGGSGWGDGEGGFLWLLVILLLAGGRGFGGFGGGYGGGAGMDGGTGDVDRAVAQARADGLSDQVVIDAIQGNGNAINQLASSLHCDINSIQTVLCGMDKSIMQVGNQIGLTSTQIINAVQAGNCQLTQAIADCCCKTQTAILTQGYETRIQNMEQTNQLTGVMNAGFNLLGNKIDAQTQTMLNSFQGLKDYFTTEKINALQLENSQLRQTNTLQAVVDAATTPIQNRVETLLSRSTPQPIPAYPAPQYATGYAFGIIPTSNVSCGCGNNWNNNNCGCGCGCGYGGA